MFFSRPRGRNGTEYLMAKLIGFRCRVSGQPLGGGADTLGERETPALRNLSKNGLLFPGSAVRCSGQLESHTI